MAGIKSRDEPSWLVAAVHYVFWSIVALHKNVLDKYFSPAVIKYHWSFFVKVNKTCLLDLLSVRFIYGFLKYIRESLRLILTQSLRSNFKLPGTLAAGICEMCKYSWYYFGDVQILLILFSNYHLLRRQENANSISWISVATDYATASAPSF